MASVDILIGSAGIPDIPSAWAAIPNDTVGSGNSYNILFDAGELIGTVAVTLSGKTTGPSNRITFTAKAGKSFLDNPNIATLPYAYNATAGAAYKTDIAYISASILVDNPYITFRGMQFRNANGDGGGTLKFTRNATNCIVDNCIVDSSVNYRSSWTFTADTENLLVRNTLIVHNSDQADPVYLSSNSSTFENVTVVRPARFGSVNSGMSIFGGNTVKNCLALGVPILTSTPNTVGSNNACTGTVGFGTNNIENLTFASVVVDPNGDYRTKANAATIDAGAAPSAGNTNAPNGVRQQGTAADIGAWEYPSVVQAPSAAVTGIAVAGQTVTVTGTTTGTPTSGSASISPTAAPYNGAVAQGPVALTFGSGTFSAVFNNVAVGAYSLAFTVSNASYNGIAGTNPGGDFTVTGALATSVVQDPVDGQVLPIHGTTSGNPTSGTLLVPAAATNPNGAIDKTMALTLGTGTFTVAVPLTPGNYDKAILRLTTAAGTSLPQAGTSPVSIMGISGNPDAPPIGATTPDTTAPTITGAAVANSLPTVVVLTASETLDGAYTPPASAFAVAGHTVSSAAIAGQAINLTVTPAFANGEAARTASYTQSGSNGARDPSGNLLASFTALAITNNVAAPAPSDTTAPTITAAAVADNAPGTVVLTASEALDTTKVPAASAFTVAGHTVNTVAVAGSAISLTVTPAFTNGEAARVATYTQPSTNGARDSAGNLLASFSARAIANNVAAQVQNDTAPPTVTAVAVADGTPSTVVLTTSETLDAAFVPALSAFTVSGRVVTAVAVSGSSMNLTVTPAFAYGEAARTVAYAQPSTGGARDTAGNLLASFSARAITNNVAPPVVTEPGFTRSKVRTIKVKAAPLTFEGTAFWDMRDAKRPVGSIDKDATIDISFDWTDVLSDITDTIDHIQFDIDGLTSLGGFFVGGFATIFVTAPTEQPRITCRITTKSVPARVEDRTVFLKVEAE